MSWQSPLYLSWVRRQPCLFPGCGQHGGEAHHVKGVGHFSGGSMKAPDILAMALCRDHHHAIHHTTDPELLYQQYSMVWRTLRLGRDQGVIELHPHFYRPVVSMELGKMFNPAPVSEGVLSAMWRDWLAALVTMCEDGAVSIQRPRMMA